MEVFCCDESNAQATKNVDFFVYGGLAIHGDSIGPLSDEIDACRRAAGFTADASLKFRTTSRPPNVLLEEWTGVKAATIAACKVHGAKLIAAVIHHRIARGQKAHLTEWQLNTCIEEFNRRLTLSEDYGIVIIDRIGDQREYSLLRDKFRVGGATPWGKNREFKQIVSYSSTSDGASHVASATDVVLGSLAYCINQRNVDAVRCGDIFRSIEPMLWVPDATACDGKSKRGLIFNPASITAPSYVREYDELRAHLDRLTVTT